MNLPRSTYYRLLTPPKKGGVNSVRVAHSHRKLSREEVDAIIDVMHEVRFVDKSPAQIYSTLLDEGVYLCSVSTMYRILRSLQEVKERRNVLQRTFYERPELLATGPNQVWSWDITKLRGPEKWVCYYLYVIIDIYSRYIVGWLIAENECAELAEILISEACSRQRIRGKELIIHSDRGPAMTSKKVADLLTLLGVGKSLNRPHVSNDNPFSESQFKTMKYHHTFPNRFGSIEHARSFCRYFFDWYNNKHYHSGIAFMKPSFVHYGKSEECNRQRQQVLEKAFQKHPERFVLHAPRTLPVPPAAWINPPVTEDGELDTISSITIIGEAK
ncbi:MAG: IS3 family transposase [Candidatus Obscuribacterales bacterium]|nr:IS3 family transposase [Candidatus Obscuribacterales bacterium]